MSGEQKLLWNLGMNYLINDMFYPWLDHIALIKTIEFNDLIDSSLNLIGTFWMTTQYYFASESLQPCLTLLKTKTIQWAKNFGQIRSNPNYSTN